MGGDTAKTKIIELKELNNFVVRNFLHLKSSIKGKLWPSFLTFEIQILQMTLDGEMTKTKVVDLEKLCNFVVYNFII